MAPILLFEYKFSNYLKNKIKENKMNSQTYDGKLFY